MSSNVGYHGGFEPTLRLGRREARRAVRELEKLISIDLEMPVTFTECLALGAWRRLSTGEREFSPPMWDQVGDLIRTGSGAEPLYPDDAARPLSVEEGIELAQRLMVLHAGLATGHFRYREDLQNIHALLAASGVLGMLEHGRRRFVGAPVLAFIDTAGR